MKKSGKMPMKAKETMKDGTGSGKPEMKKGSSKGSGMKGMMKGKCF